jgi:hypothetical protein
VVLEGAVRLVFQWLMTAFNPFIEQAQQFGAPNNTEALPNGRKLQNL